MSAVAPDKQANVCVSTFERALPQLEQSDSCMVYGSGTDNRVSQLSFLNEPSSYRVPLLDIQRHIRNAVMQ